MARWTLPWPIPHTQALAVERQDVSTTGQNLTHYIVFNNNQAGGADLASNWARLVPNGTNLGLFNISFLLFWRQNEQKTDHNKVPDLSHLVPIWPN